jgi:uncharacterized membrane protein YebE (DUF533 family)
VVRLLGNTDSLIQSEWSGIGAMKAAMFRFAGSGIDHRRADYATEETMMDYRQIADLLLESGQELARKGQSVAERQLQLPPEGPERDAMLNTLGKSAAAGGLLALLLGTRAGRKLTGSALKLGSLAALGAVAYRAFQKWQGETGDAGTSIDQLTGPAASARSLTLLKAMVAAAKADGHIDAAERQRIEDRLSTLALDAETVAFFRDELERPLDAQAVAAAADSPTAAAEIYLASLLVIDEHNDQEREYLENLARELRLAPELVAAIQNQVDA